jgi:ABC-2 type transport system permease protein
VTLTVRAARIRAEALAGGKSFLRQRTAVFFTFFFPIIIVGIFGFLVNSTSASGLFAKPQGYYVPGYLAVVVVLTPLSRVGSTVARHQSSRRFEKLATTPLSRLEWLVAHTLVNVALIGGAVALLLGLLVVVGRATVTFSPLLAVFVVLGSALFCAFGAILGSIADSQDGVVAASNGLGIPMVFLADTFVPPERLPAAVRPLVDLLPLTYFARGVRAVTAGSGSASNELLVLVVLTAVAFAVAALVLPWTE